LSCDWAAVCTSVSCRRDLEQLSTVLIVLLLVEVCCISGCMGSVPPVLVYADSFPTVCMLLFAEQTVAVQLSCMAYEFVLVGAGQHSTHAPVQRVPGAALSHCQDSGTRPMTVDEDSKAELDDEYDIAMADTAV